MNDVTFRCCKYLDHNKNYIGCELKSCHDIYVYWERGKEWTDLNNGARDVQFCSKRGRLNFKSACIEGGGGECSLYEEEERTVEIEQSLEGGGK